MPENEKKGITVKIDAELHAQVKAFVEEHDLTMAEFVSKALDDELHPKITQEVKDMGNMRTMAFQVPEELFQQIKDYLNRHNMTQKEFVIGLITTELEHDMALRSGVAEEQVAPEVREEESREETETEDEDIAEDEELDESEGAELDEDESEDEELDNEESEDAELDEDESEDAELDEDVSEDAELDEDESKDAELDEDESEDEELDNEESEDEDMNESEDEEMSLGM